MNCVEVELVGGLELLAPTNNQSIKILAPETTPAELCMRIRQELLTREQDSFCDESGNLCDGILLLINDVDAAALSDIIIKNGDKVTFISMIHGG